MLWRLLSERKSMEREAVSLKLKYSAETIEYLKLYERWMLLPVEERTQPPEGLNLNANKSPEQIAQEQQERLKADMDKLSAGQMTVYPFADDYYGPSWKEKIVLYKQQKEKQEFLKSVSIACTATGILLTGWVVLFVIYRIFVKIFTGIIKVIFRRNKNQSVENQETDAGQDNEEQIIKAAQDEINGSMQDEQLRNIPSVLANSGWKYAGSFSGEHKPVPRQRKRIPAKNRPQNEQPVQQEFSDAQAAKQENSTQLKPAEKVADDCVNVTKSETIINNNVDITNSKGHTNLIDNTLKDLTQQVSAIREYAANQQNRLERFQDGYDWNIIKTFCLRIIRCIDNIENRISQLSDNVQMANFEEIRDELVFALESSGIEQFQPEINSEYRGQEKTVEAIKEKKHNKDPEKKGKIESVLKPGYQFYIDDENIKIVRPAQVRLYA